MVNYEIIFERQLDNGDLLYNFIIPPKELILFGYILESLEGWAFYTTIDNKRSILLVEVIKDYVNDFKFLLEKLKNH